jgi:hypothetical protein
MSTPIYTLPAESSCCALLEVPINWIPIVGGLLGQLEAREVWASETDWVGGYPVVVQMQEDLMGKCIEALIASNNQIYRLLDTSLNGTAYQVIGHDPDTAKPIFDPVIPEVPDSATGPGQLPTIALRRRLERLIDVIDNGFNGTLIPDQPSSQPSTRDNLEAIRQLLAQAGSDNGNMEDLINLILMALA